MTRIGSTFTGFAGLDLAVADYFGGSVVWHCENDPAAVKVLRHHWPTVDNLGDITAVQWDSVPAIDVLTGGFPCQDVSAAGKRAGLMPDSRSGLWAHMARAIYKLRPRLVIAENVRGLLSAEAHSVLEPCPWCLGDERDKSLRALGAVLGDMASLGYDAQWCGLRAADVGAPHGRFRVFVVAEDTHSDERGQSASRQAGSGQPRCDPRGRGRTSTPDPSQWGRSGWQDHDVREPRGDASERGDVAADPDGFDAGTVATGDRRGEPEDASRNSDSAVADPEVDGRGEGQPEPEGLEAGSDAALDRGSAVPQWGKFEPAIRQWEDVLGRAAPIATEAGRSGNPRLSPVFVEWLMGLDKGHVTGVEGLSRSDQLRILGNGVVPQQARAALTRLLGHEGGSVCG